MIETELCAYGIEACRAAARAGLTRVELCASPYEGGTTPSAAAIRQARRIGGVRLSVMIRPRGGDFLYTDEEFAQMLDDVRFARAEGADCVVAGLLTADGQIDEARTAALVVEADSMEVTFHRAFDMVRDQREALEALVRAGCRRVLTSGGRNTAEEGLGRLRELAHNLWCGRPTAASASWPAAACAPRMPRGSLPRGSMPCTSVPAACVRAAWPIATPPSRWAASRGFPSMPPSHATSGRLPKF